MNKYKFIEFIKHPEILDESTMSELKEIIDFFPYFQAARMLHMRILRNVDSYKFESELSKNAIYIPDRSVLYRFLDTNYAFEERIELIPMDDDTFREFTENKSANNNIDEVESKIQIPIPFELIDDQSVENQNQSLSKNDLIDRFIQRKMTSIPVVEEEVEEEEDLAEKIPALREDFITETLATVYLKQGLLVEALQSYEKLSLKFPEKNSYFAGQIENIKKLISKE